MLTHNKFIEKRDTPCPYGRKANVGDVRCMNCRFHHIEKEYCSGEVDTVMKHMKILKLDY